MPLPTPAFWVANAVPLPVIQAAANRAFATVLDHHPGLLERMGSHANQTFAFVPTDLPWVFLITPGTHRLTVARHPARVLANATISAPIVLLLALLEGKADGDAAFFARGIEIAGDMEAILAVRNALDDAAIDLPRELASGKGPLHRRLESALARLRAMLLAREGVRWN
jgi:predicted lipid carrier protein YhbT